ncbi:MAG: BatD family protein [Puniceicoccales bacterium]|jgi:hypothetical protein|nr:BatD family protein [Puniceicoccales bacterium]
MKIIQKLFIVLCLLQPWLSMGNNMQITARFDPDEISMDESSKYIIEFIGITDADVKFPKVHGLKFGNSMQEYTTMTSINGTVTQKSVKMYSIIPLEPGTVTIPSYKIHIGSESYEIPEATIKITNQKSTTGSKTSSQNSQKNPLGNIDIEFDKTQEHFVGESIPIKITAKMSAAYQWRLQNNIPKKIGDSFSDGPFSDGEVSQANDQTLCSWNTVITPLKSGNNQFSYELPISVILQYEFSFFPMEKNMVLRSDNIPLEIKPLPSNSQPSDFSGAIGDFKLGRVKLSSDRALVDDPITMTVEILGHGNFSRIKTPDLDENEHWKVYTPKAIFAADDQINHYGTKTFEYVIMPKTTGQIKIPTLKFSYFDLKSKEYKVVSMGGDQEIIVSRSGNFAQPNNDGDPKTNELKKIKTYDDAIIYMDSTNYPSLRQNLYGIWFWLLNLAICSTLSILLVRMGFSSTNQKSTYNRKKSSIKEEFFKAHNAALNALKVSDYKAFYEHARLSIAKKFELISGKKIDQNLHNIDEIFIEIGLDEETKTWLKNFLSESEIVVFSNHQPTMEKTKEMAKEFDKFINNFGRQK